MNSRDRDIVERRRAGQGPINGRIIYHHRAGSEPQKVHAAASQPSASAVKKAQKRRCDEASNAKFDEEIRKYRERALKRKRKE